MGRAELQRRLAEAEAAGDRALAATIREELGGDEAPLPPSRLRLQKPGAMGLGTSEQEFRPAAGWKPPKKPSPLTANHRPRGGRKP